jgi:hypothetical protein
MLFAPPRHGKSELSTRRFPAWFMARNPEKNVISASYNGDFATTFGRDVRNIVLGKEFKTLFPDVARSGRTTVQPTNGSWNRAASTSRSASAPAPPVRAPICF